MLDVSALVALITPPKTAVVEPIVPVVVVIPVVLNMEPVSLVPVPKFIPPSLLTKVITDDAGLIFPSAVTPQVEMVDALDVLEHVPFDTATLYAPARDGE